MKKIILGFPSLKNIAAFIAKSKIFYLDVNFCNLTIICPYSEVEMTLAFSYGAKVLEDDSLQYA